LKLEPCRLLWATPDRITPVLVIGFQNYIYEAIDTREESLMMGQEYLW